MFAILKRQYPGRAGTQGGETVKTVLGPVFDTYEEAAAYRKDNGLHPVMDTASHFIVSLHHYGQWP